MLLPAEPSPQSDFLLLHSWKKLYCVPHFLYPLLSWWVPGRVYNLPIGNSAVLVVHQQDWWLEQDLFPWWLYLLTFPPTVYEGLPHQHLFSHHSSSGWAEMESPCHFSVPFPLTAEGAKHSLRFVCHVYSCLRDCLSILLVHLLTGSFVWGHLIFFFFCSFFI